MDALQQLKDEYGDEITIRAENLSHALFIISELGLEAGYLSTIKIERYPILLHVRPSSETHSWSSLYEHPFHSYETMGEVLKVLNPLTYQLRLIKEEIYGMPPDKFLNGWKTLAHEHMGLTQPEDL